MTGQRVGYVRVSTIDQNTGRQLQGVELDRTFTDKISGKNADRPALDEMLAYVRQGDTVYVHSIDRLARNIVDLRQTVDKLINKGVAVQFVKENLTFDADNTSPFSTLMLSVLGAFAEAERAIMLERQREGIELARQRGAYKGKQFVLDREQIERIHSALDAGVPKSKIARDLGITRATIYNYLKPGYADAIT